MMSYTDKAVPTRGLGKYCYRWLPARLVFVALGFVAFNLVYAYKVVLSVAIVAMVRSNATESDGGATGEFEWSHSAQAQLLSSFFYGYVITQLPAGVLSEMFGAKWIFGGAILSCAVLSLLSPLLARWSYYAFLVARIGQGLAEGVAFPSMNAMLARWVPKMERARISTVIYTGSSIGSVIALTLTGWLCDTNFLGGWPAMFYLLGIAGCIWFGLWFFLYYETPERHPHISHRELSYILGGQGAEKPMERPPIPWKSIGTSVPMIALIITHFGQNWGFLTVLTLMPTYFKDVLDLDIKDNGLWSSLPWLLQAVCAWLASVVGDKLRQSGRLPVNVIRKVSNSIAFFTPGVLLILVPFANEPFSIALFTASMALNGCTYSGFMVTHVDMAPDFAGTLMGITNSLSNTAGFIAPQVADAIVGSNKTRKGWSPVFYISGGVYIVTGIIYIVFASANLQPWGKFDPKTKLEDSGQETANNAEDSNNTQNSNRTFQGVTNNGFES